MVTKNNVFISKLIKLEILHFVVFGSLKTPVILLYFDALKCSDPDSHTQACPKRLIPLAHSYLTSPLCYQGTMTKMQRDTKMGK